MFKLSCKTGQLQIKNYIISYLYKLHILNTSIFRELWYQHVKLQKLLNNYKKGENGGGAMATKDWFILDVSIEGSRP
jgi:hypothetical protein